MPSTSSPTPSSATAARSAARSARVIRGGDGDRVVGMDEFHRGAYRTAVQDDELLVEIRVPCRRRAGSAYEKVERRVGDWAVGAAGAWLALDEAGMIADAGVALAAVGGEISCSEAQAQLRGRLPADDAFKQAGRLAATACAP